jgi:hypothetical protein
MKTRLAVVVSMVSFACGVENEGDAMTQGVETETSGLKQGGPQPDVLRIPIAIDNSEANDGLDPSGIGYPGWAQNDWGSGFFRTRIAYDAALNSNVFNILTYNAQTMAEGTYAMFQFVQVDSMSAEARQAISEGYPIECQAAMNVSYEIVDDFANLQMTVLSLDRNQNWIDSCDKFVSTENRWMTSTCGPIASAGMDSFYVAFYCRNSNYCKIDKVKCDVVKRAGFERFKPVGVIALPFDLSQF